MTEKYTATNKTFWAELTTPTFLCVFRSAWRRQRLLWVYCCFSRARGSAVGSTKVADSIPDEVDFFFQFVWSFQPQYGPGLDSDSNRNEYQEYSLGVKADKLPATMSSLSSKCGSLDVSQHYGPSPPITGSALLLRLLLCIKTANIRNRQIMFQIFNIHFCNFIYLVIFMI
jgi:hypothetical protein